MSDEVTRTERERLRKSLSVMYDLIQRGRGDEIGGDTAMDLLDAAALLAAPAPAGAALDVAIEKAEAEILQVLIQNQGIWMSNRRGLPTEHAKRTAAALARRLADPAASGDEGEAGKEAIVALAEETGQLVSITFREWGAGPLPDPDAFAARYGGPALGIVGRRARLILE